MLKSLLALEKESGETIWAYQKEISFMRTLILEGKWIEAEEFLKPLEKNKKFNYRQAIIAIKKQRLFELIETQTEDANDNALECLIKELQAICTKDAFEDIIKCLNVTSINEMNQYKNWTVLNGRFECFNIIKELLSDVYPSILANGYDKETKIKKGLLIEVMNKIGEIVNRNRSQDKKLMSLIDIAEEFVNNYNSNSNNQETLGKCDEKYEVTFNPKALNKEIIVKPKLKQNQMESKSITKQKTKEIDNKTKAQNNVIKEISNNKLDAYSSYHAYNYNVSSFKLGLTITDTNPIRTSCFSSKGDFFALGTNSKSLKIFDMHNVLNQFNIKTTLTEPLLTTSTLPLVFERTNHHLGSLYCLDWSTSGKLIASGSNDKVIKIIVVQDLISWSNKSSILEMSMEGHKGTIRSLVFDPLSDNSLYSGGTLDNSIFIWDIEKGVCKSHLNGHSNDIHAIKWSNDSKLFASTGKDKSILFWDVHNSQVINTIKALNYDDINDISIYSSNQNMSNTAIAAAHNGGYVTIWDYNRSSMIKEISCGDKSEMRSIAYSPDGRYLVVGGFNKKITLIDVKDDYKVVNTLEHLDKVVSVKWHPEKPIIVSTSADKTARVWLPTAVH